MRHSRWLQSASQWLATSPLRTDFRSGRFGEHRFHRVRTVQLSYSWKFDGSTFLTVAWRSPMGSKQRCKGCPLPSFGGPTTLPPSPRGQAHTLSNPRRMSALEIGREATVNNWLTLLRGRETTLPPFCWP